MRYLLLIHPGASHARFDTLDEDAQAEILRAYLDVADAPGVVGSHQLHPPDTATTVRVQDGRTLTTDGPFIEAKEAVGGFVLFEADDLDGAIGLAARIPAARMGGAVEVRPVVER
jgi:hypothetical protein